MFSNFQEDDFYRFSDNLEPRPQPRLKPDTDGFYRPVRLDEYEKQQQRQNNSMNCEHCDSSWGHVAICPLLNREVAEARSAADGVLNIPDQHELKSWGILWTTEEVA
jgi:hypothetical protein